MEEQLKNSITQYLLGELSEAESDELAERYLDDDKLFEEMKIIEEELIDSYLRGELSQAQRQAFEANYLGTPARRERVRSAVAFRQAVNTFQPWTIKRPIQAFGNALRKARPKFFGPVGGILLPAMAAVIALLAIGGTLVVVQNIRLQRRIDQTQAEKKALEEQGRQALDELDEQKAANAKLKDENQLMRDQSDQLREELDSLKTPPQRSGSQSPDVSRELAFNLMRDSGGGTAVTWEIPRRAKLLELKLGVESTTDFMTFHVELQRAGKTVWDENYARQAIATSDKQVRIRVPANRLPTGEYTLNLTGTSTDGKSYLVFARTFRVVRK